MELALSSDDSCDSEMRNMKTQLSEFGLDEENLSKEEMIDLLKALKNSKSSAQEDDLLRQKVEDPEPEMPESEVEPEVTVDSPKKTMKRRYLDVRDRRMPWSLLPSTITQAEKARSLAVYIKLMSINTYHQARQSPNFTPWPPAIQIAEETTRMQPLRSTRSGRSAPNYAGFDDDPNDLDFVISKPKKRKTSHTEPNAGEGTTAPKFPGLKRKGSKDENSRPIKELRKEVEDNNLEVVAKPPSRIDTIFSLIED